jgi:hypothetical protein
MMKMLTHGGLLVALAMVTTGCLVKDDIATWYLESNGTVTWSVLEKDVHSDAEAELDRNNEEANYLASVRSLDHAMARGFAQLQPIEIKTRILRASAPFSVATDARFANLGKLGQELIWRLGLAGTSVLTHGPDGETWIFAVRDPHAPAGSARPDEDLTAVAGSLDGLKVVLVDGRLIAAEGFQVSPDHRTATLLKWDDDAFRGDAMLTLKLTWK